MDLSREPKGLPRWIEAPLAALGLLVTAPLLLGTATAVALTSKGPVLFRQQRVGRHGRPFTLLKFRSMRVQNRGPQVTSGDDSRITTVGRILRATKLDELPELWNILVGEMSFVGPRPEVPRYVELNDPIWQKVLSVRPGLTDPITLRLRNEQELLAQVSGDVESFYRRELLPWKIRGYCEALERRTALGDLQVLVQTLFAVVRVSSDPGPSLEEIRRADP